MNAKHKMLFFRDQADEASVDGIDDQLCIPASRFVSMSPASATTLDILFRSVKNNDLSNNSQLTYDKVTLTVTQGDIQEVMDSLISFFNSGNNSNGFVVIADDCTTTDSATTALNDLTIGAVYAHPSISGVASITVADKLYRADTPLTVGLGATPTVSPDGTSSAQTLSVNTRYTQARTDANDYLIPSAVAGKAGDWIEVVYIADLANSAAHTYTTTTDTAYALGSVLKAPSHDGTRVGRIDHSIAADNVITITGAANGDCGIGTTLKFVNRTGTTNGWAVEGIIEGKGTCGAASAAAFS